MVVFIFSVQTKHEGAECLIFGSCPRFAPKTVDAPINPVRHIGRKLRYSSNRSNCAPSKTRDTGTFSPVWTRFTHHWHVELSRISVSQYISLKFRKNCVLPSVKMSINCWQALRPAKKSGCCRHILLLLRITVSHCVSTEGATFCMRNRQIIWYWFQYDYTWLVLYWVWVMSLSRNAPWS